MASKVMNQALKIIQINSSVLINYVPSSLIFQVSVLPLTAAEEDI